jgi:hypothetical protein
MLKILKITAQVVWAVSVIGLFTFIGAFDGYMHRGILGSIVVGGIGFFFGSILAAFPSAALQLLWLLS